MDVQDQAPSLFLQALAYETGKYLMVRIVEPSQQVLSIVLWE
jgi:hypothetical protein